MHTTSLRGSRHADEIGCTQVYAEGLSLEGVGLAVTNRVERAAGFHVIQLSDGGDSMNILFVCTGNTCRSPMAEELLRCMAKELQIDDLEVSSAGTDAGRRAARVVRREHGHRGTRRRPFQPRRCAADGR